MRIVPIYWIATSIKVVVLLLAAGYISYMKVSLVHTIKSCLFVPGVNSEGTLQPLLDVDWKLLLDGVWGQRIGIRKLCTH